ncbi:G-protein coupled receptor family C group 6 member A isoform X1 [Echeneis naucrates]|uniref:G-protein coupled receptor family C group 6 member A n=1 Tax=Echeneis naucrates TaxID=173247 RepID=A0A665T666_ECHNA|nr:G-protein coupled receptor family C group 6 member A isoform X1 [Echeneis naucrates]
MPWTALIICSHLTLLTVILETGQAAAENDTRVPAATAPGDVIIGGMFSIHEDVEKRKKGSFEPQIQPCVRFKNRGLVHTLAMINAIEVMNKQPQLRAVNITLGYRITDSCSDVSTALRATTDFLKQGQCHAGSSNCGQPIMAIIGAALSETSIAIARQLTLQMVPQISCTSTAVSLSDKSRFPAFMRTIPNDLHQTAAMAHLLECNNWTWVGIIITDGSYGRSALESFTSSASNKSICVAFKWILPVFVTSEGVSYAIKQTATEILQNPKVKVIVSFAKASHMEALFEELKNQTRSKGNSMELMKRVWVASDSWSLSMSVLQKITLKEIGYVVGFTFKNGNVSSFKDYLSKMDADGHRNTDNNPFLQQFYTQLNDSRFSTDAELVSEGVKLLKKETDNDTILSLEMAVSAIAQAVASVCKKEDCKTPGKVQPWKVNKALSKQEFELQGKIYMFDSNGDINQGYEVVMWQSNGREVDVHNFVAEYDLNTNSFHYTNRSTIQKFINLKNIFSKCSNSCKPGQSKKTAEGQHTCCYECINCAKNYYSNGIDMDQCLTCDEGKEWSDEGSSNCTPKAQIYFSWHDGFAVVLLTFAAMGIVLVFMVSALFFHKRATPVVKAAGGPLSQVILFSLVISYVSAVLFVGRPNGIQCKAQQMMFGISFTLCISCILVKSLRILMAFQLNPAVQVVLRQVHKPYVTVGIVVGLQVVICICWLALRSPSKEILNLPKTLLERCNKGSYVAFGVMLGYIAILAFVCFICAFKGRKLPQHYNEAKFITFSTLLFLISWLLFIPIYVTTPGRYISAVEMTVILISNYSILSCHFFPKCFTMLFKKEKNTESAFRKNLYEYSNKSVDSVSWSSWSESQSSSQHVIISTLSPVVPPAKSAVVTDCKDTTTFKGLYRGQHSWHCHSRRSSI